MRRILAVVLLFCVTSLLAEPAPASPACSSRVHRQFDFWIGTWKANDRKTGNYLGMDRVTPEMGGCVLHERWSARTGTFGESINGFDATRGAWHQSWMDDAGHVLLFDGGFANGVMTLTARSRDVSGKPVISRLTYSSLPQRKLHVTYATFDSRRREWQMSFDGIYTRM